MTNKIEQNCGTCKHYVEKAILIRNNYFEGYCKENVIFTTSDWYCEYYKNKSKRINHHHKNLKILTK